MSIKVKKSDKAVLGKCRIFPSFWNSEKFTNSIYAL